MYHIVHQPMFGTWIRRTNDDGTISTIPAHESNTDYQAYLAWVAEGNTAEEWQPDSE